jgi:hypothetical protein
MIKWSINYANEGYVECPQLKLDIPLSVLIEHICRDLPTLRTELQKYKSLEEDIAFLEWCEIDLDYYIETYINELNLKDLSYEDDDI